MDHRGTPRRPRDIGDETPTEIHPTAEQTVQSVVRWTEEAGRPEASATKDGETDSSSFLSPSLKDKRLCNSQCRLQRTEPVCPHNYC